MRIKKPILFIFLFLSMLSLHAQPGGGPGNPPNPPDFEGDIPTPIDNHIWFLIIVAIALGIFILKSKKAQTSK